MATCILWSQLWCFEHFGKWSRQSKKFVRSEIWQLRIGSFLGVRNKIENWKARDHTNVTVLTFGPVIQVVSMHMVLGANTIPECSMGRQNNIAKWIWTIPRSLPRSRLQWSRYFTPIPKWRARSVHCSCWVEGERVRIGDQGIPACTFVP